MWVVREQAALVAHHGGLVLEQEGGRVARKGGVVDLHGDRFVDEPFEVPLLADHAAHEVVTVHEEHVRVCQPARCSD